MDKQQQQQRHHPSLCVILVRARVKTASLLRVAMAVAVVTRCVSVPPNMASPHSIAIALVIAAAATTPNSTRAGTPMRRRRVWHLRRQPIAIVHVHRRRRRIDINAHRLRHDLSLARIRRSINDRHIRRDRDRHRYDLIRLHGPETRSKKLSMLK